LSSEPPFGLIAMEKLIGLIMVAIGVITFYVTYTNLSSAPNPMPFLAASLIFAVLGILLIVAKSGEKED
jgi:hypothetical protein